jgi:hypothetical protein
MGLPEGLMFFAFGPARPKAKRKSHVCDSAFCASVRNIISNPINPTRAYRPIKRAKSPGGPVEAMKEVGKRRKIDSSVPLEGFIRKPTNASTKYPVNPVNPVE